MFGGNQSYFESSWKFLKKIFLNSIRTEDVNFSIKTPYVNCEFNLNNTFKEKFLMEAILTSGIGLAFGSYIGTNYLYKIFTRKNPHVISPAENEKILEETPIEITPQDNCPQIKNFPQHSIFASNSITEKKITKNYSAFYCPFGKVRMGDPVTNSLGNTFERYAIMSWLEHYDTDPSNGLAITKHLIPNKHLKYQIHQNIVLNAETFENSTLFICPLTKKPFIDPVINSAGWTYERAALDDWLKENNIDPVTKELITKEIVSNNNLKQQFNEYWNQNNLLQKSQLR